MLYEEDLMGNAQRQGDYLIERLNGLRVKYPSLLKEIRGRGLMIGIEYDFPVEKLRHALLFGHRQFTGVAGKNTIRLLPSLALGIAEADQFLEALAVEMHRNG